MTRVFDVRWILLAAGAVGSTACAGVPGDINNFDPVRALPQVLAFAGPSKRLTGFRATNIREGCSSQVAHVRVRDSARIVLLRA